MINRPLIYPISDHSFPDDAATAHRTLFLPRVMWSSARGLSSTPDAVHGSEAPRWSVVRAKEYGTPGDRHLQLADILVVN